MTAVQFADHFASHPRIAKRAGEIKFLKTGCWIWPGAFYPQVWLGDRVGRVHRISLEIKIGEPLGQLEARHDCDTPLCVNPSHLRPGTHADNMHDMFARGRHRTDTPRGLRNVSATITDAEIGDALDLLDAGASLSAVGRRYGVTHSTVQTWRDGKFRTEARDAWLARHDRAS